MKIVESGVKEWKASTAKEVGKGTGQRLAISHSLIVDKHGGTISFESVLGEGTTFLIRLSI
ncbi:MAG: ATP-binding protein [Syntrophobacteraceae bacterium]